MTLAVLHHDKDIVIPLCALWIHMLCKCPAWFYHRKEVNSMVQFDAHIQPRLGI